MFANRTIRGTKVPSIAVYIVCVILIVLYGWFLRKTETKDRLAVPFCPDNPLIADIDGWSITHFLFFGLLGAMYPGHYIQFALVGIGWELVETALGQNKIEVSGKRLQLVGDQDDDGKPTGDDDAYWYGRQSDVLIDVLGYILGSALAQKYWPNET
jgi:hypothetical protein